MKNNLSFIEPSAMAEAFRQSRVCRLCILLFSIALLPTSHAAQADLFEDGFEEIPIAFFAGGLYTGAPTVEGVELNSTTGLASSTNAAVGVWESDTGAARWIAQITVPGNEGKLDDVRVLPTRSKTLLVAANILSDGSGANPVSINIYNGDNVLAAGPYGGSLHANFQTEQNNAVNNFLGTLIVGYDLETGSVSGWSAVVDGSPTEQLASMFLRQFFLDGNGDAVMVIAHRPGVSGDVTHAIYSDGIEVDSPVYDDARPGADAWGLGHNGTARFHVDAHGSYVSGSFDWNYPKTNDSGSLFHEGWRQPRVAGNGSKFPAGFYSTQFSAATEIVLNARDGTPQLSGSSAKWRASTFAKYDLATRDVDWIHGVGSSAVAKDQRAGPHQMLADGSIIALVWNVASGSTGSSYFITQTAGSDVSFSKNDGDVILVRWDVDGKYVYHKLVTVTNNGAPGGAGEGRGILVDEDNDRLYIITRVRNGGSTTFTYGNGETNEYALTDAPGGNNESWVVSLHTLSTGEFQWLTEIRENSGFPGSDVEVGSLGLSRDGTELYALGAYVTGGNASSGATFGHNAGDGRHAPGTPVVLTDNLSRRYVGRFVMDPATLEPLRWDGYPPHSGPIISTGAVFWNTFADSD